MKLGRTGHDSSPETVFFDERRKNEWISRWKYGLIRRL